MRVTQIRHPKLRSSSIEFTPRSVQNVATQTRERHTAHRSGQSVNASSSTSERIGIARERSESEASTSGDQAPETLRQEAWRDRKEICDKVIAVFRAKPTSDWRKLIAYSRQWGSLHKSLFARLDDRAAAERDPKERAELRKLARKLRPVHEEVAAHNGLLDGFLSAPEADWEAAVVSRRPALTTAFFEHMEHLIRASADDDKRADELARVATRLLMLVEAFDKVATNETAMKSAAEEFKNLLNQVQSVEDADKRIDELATSGRLDPALLLTMAKAYSAAKDTDYTREEVKDVMAHLYFRAKESFAAQQPASVRILKHLLWLESPQDRRQAMEQAFTPGAELSTVNQDYLMTTPEELDSLIEMILGAFESGRGRVSGMQADANALMNPEVVERMRVLRTELRRHFL